MKCIHIILILILGIVIIISSGCVKIQTGQTADEAAQSSELRAKQIRSHWANRINSATPKEIGYLIGEHYKNINSIIYDYGNQIAQRWQEGQEGRSEKIEDVEMRKMVDLWLSGQKPILKAYEDNLEYAWEQLKLSDYFNEKFMSQLEELIEMYYRLYSKILIPQGSMEDYNYILDTVKSESDEILEEYLDELDDFN